MEKIPTPIVVVSASRDAETIGKHIGARAVIRKPFDVGELIARLRTTMHPHSATA